MCRRTPSPPWPARVRWLAVVLWLAAAPAAPEGPAPDREGVAIEVTRENDAYRIRAVAEVPANRAAAWRVLTDYERLSDFVPDLHASRVLAREGARVTVEQKGEARLWIFRVPIEVRFVAEEQPYETVTSRAIAGSFRELTGRYELLPQAGALRLVYTGRLVPDFGMPPFIDTALVRTLIRRQFTAMVEEIRRRAAATPPGGA
jgi:ribosome-associated toxin RatA of RatAB toxin-antitoxin module